MGSIENKLMINDALFRRFFLNIQIFKNDLNDDL